MKPAHAAVKVHGIRHHTKSRNGCIDCKFRRVKCDEQKPACSACARRQTQCRYTPRFYCNPQSNVLPSNSLLTEANGQIDPTEQHSRVTEVEPLLCDLLPRYTSREMDHLRLLHHYSNFTVESFATTFQLEGRAFQSLRLDIPRLAFQNHFLMDAILSVALLHLSSTDESAKDGLPRLALYRDQAFRRLRVQLTRNSHVMIGERPDEKFRAVVVTSILLAVTALAADRFFGHEGIWLTNYLALSIGPRTILPWRGTALGAFSSARQGRGNERMSNKDSDFYHPCPVSVVPDLELVHLGVGENDEDWDCIDDLRRAIKGMGRLFGALFCPKCDASSCVSNVVDLPCIVSKVRTWPFAFVTSGFVDMARRGRPRALVVMAYYLAFFPWLPQTWLYQDIAPIDMDKLADAVGPSWQRCLAAPKVAVLVKDLDLLAPFLSGLAYCQGTGSANSLEGFFDSLD
ncbi:hypothetical protein BDP55DRAFT_622606 [Colletotrichum godetiae]|uniref:Zn(2)-C6 fungal-type domain-containing protein n=1 Tax=Colletotrichum godetiae TaxID=1209918 RepID=A0AAJ0ABM6_9PEZI|nr:uncharacterized protein BDP55DRAFT_622606 [Colletotrichum godetiae]KAK1658015.1 hypothetical protein BDP55DRAFT_622606 [Colletotrichum godetiae]